MRSLLSLFLLTLLLAFCFAIYEEEAGKRDWSREHIGSVSYASITSKYIYASTKNVIAALSSKDGSIAWRKVLSEQETITAAKFYADSFITATNGCTYVRLWNKDGVQLWDLPLSSAKNSNFCDIVGIGNNVAILSSDKIFIKDITKGNAVATIEAGASSLFVKFDGNKVIVANYEDSSLAKVANIRVATVDAAGLKLTGEKTYAVSSKPASLQVVGDNVVLFNTKGDIVEAFSVKNEKSLTVSSPIKVDTILSNANGVFRFTSAGSSKQLSFANDAVSAVDLADASKSSNIEDNSFAVVKRRKNSDLTITIKNAASGDNFETISFAAPESEFGNPSQVYISGSKDVLVVFEEDSLIFVRDAKVAWTRDAEALTNIASTQFVDLPQAVKSQRSPSSFIGRIERQIAAVTETIDQIVKIVQSGSFTSKSRAASSTADKFGFNKIIVAATTVGKVFGIRTVDGSVAWSIYYPLSSHFKVFVSKDTAIVLLCNKEGTVAVTLNSVDGKEIQRELVLNGQCYYDASTIKLDNSEAILILASDSKSVSVYPASATAQITKQYANKLYFHIVHQQDKSVAGYAWRGETLTQLWSTSFKESTILNVKSKDNRYNEHIYSPTYITAAGDLLYKYLNPHVLAIATESQFGHDDKARSVDIYLIDGITGDTLYHTTHQYCEGPVEMVVDEHMLVYTYTNQRTKRYELSNLKFFLTENAAMSGAINTGRGEQFSAYKFQHRPTVTKLGFIFPVGIRTFATTKTRLGITTKDFVFGLATDQVYIVHEKLIDPRRPQNVDQGAPSEITAEEGIPPYNPYIPLDPLHIISYNKTISQIYRISTAPSFMESTSHVLAQGLDLFYARTSPALTYDLLGEDFSHAILLLTVGGLILVTLVLRAYSKRRDLYRQWS